MARIFFWASKVEMYCSWRMEDSTMIDTQQCFRLITCETSAAKPNTQASPKAIRKHGMQALYSSVGFGDFVYMTCNILLVIQ